MYKNQGRFVQIDGIDGSGKSTLLAAARSWAEGRGLKIFDVVEWSKREKMLPSLEDTGDADVLLTAEPTHAWIGAAIRDEIIKRGTSYDAAFAAHAFALDRGVQYRRLILPFLSSRPGRWVIQDRGILSSLAYQPLQFETDGRGLPRSLAEGETLRRETVTVDWLLTLPGNRIALERAPDVFVFLDIDPNLAQDRLAGRIEKRDDHVYDSPEFQTALAARFKQLDVTAPLRERGTKIVTLDGRRTKDEVAGEMLRILDESA